MPQSFTSWAGSNGLAPGTSDASLLGPSPVYRSAKDQRLIAWGASPDTQFPDGYLGVQPTQTRRANKKQIDATFRQNAVSYDRGVHKGERINPGEYLWPAEFNPMTGIEYEAAGAKWAPAGTAPAVLVNDGKPGPAERPEMTFFDVDRASRLKHLAPSWR